MNLTETQFVKLVECAITKRTIAAEDLVDANWTELFSMCTKNKVYAMVWDAIEDKKLIPDDLRKVWDGKRFQIFVRQRKHYYDLCKILTAFGEQGIEYLVFKGNILAQLYPNPAYRVSADSDILVREEDKEKADSIIRGLGYTHEPQKDKVETYSNPSSGHYIELHTSIFEDYEGEQIKKLEAMHLTAPESTVRVDIGGFSMHTLGITEQLTYQFYHMIKHFVLEAANIRFMTDITLYINRYYEEINRARFWNEMKTLGYEEFCSNFLAVCERCFGLCKEFREGHPAEASDQILEAMLLDYIYNGDKQDERKNGWQLVGNMTPYFTGEKKLTSGNRFGRMIHYAFPSRENLNENYAYAKKHGILLPIAWGHRFIRTFIQRKYRPKDEDYGTLQRTNILQEKLTLLENVGLLKEK